MKRIIISCVLVMITLAGFVAYTNNPSMITPWPNRVAGVCGEGDSAGVCRMVYVWYFWWYALLCALYIFAVLHLKDVIRPTLMLVVAAWLFYYVQPHTISELKHIQTYSYEWLILLFYHWLALMVMSAIACMLWFSARKKIVQMTFLYTLVVTGLITYHGRGSVEHINPLISGLLLEQTMAMVKESWIVRIATVVAIIMVISGLVWQVREWIATGAMRRSLWVIALRYSMIMAMIAFIPLMSLPIGMKLQQQDLKLAQRYIEKLLPKLEAYYNEHQEYPHDIAQLQDANVQNIPRLLDIYDYLASGERGSFYLARPQKYCFIIPSQSIKEGFWSRTSVRGWREDTPKSSLEEEYENICDENLDDVHEALVAGHLGIPEEDDPYTQIMVEGGVRVPMQKQTQDVTPKLQNAIHDLGYQDPDIYYKAPPLPKDLEIPPEALLEELKRQPLRTD